MIYQAWTPKQDERKIAEQRVNTCRDLYNLYRTDYWLRRLENAERMLAELEPEQEAEEMKALDILVSYVPPEPDTAGESHAALIGDLPLNAMNDEQQKAWFDSVPLIDPSA